MNTIAQFLADRLIELDDDGLEYVAKLSGVPLKTARRAATGEPIAAWSALCLLAARGYDPITREQIPRKRIGKFDHRTLALMMNGHMRVKHLRVRNVADEMKVSTRVIDAICDCRPVSITNVVKACMYLGLHPFDQCDRVEAKAA